MEYKKAIADNLNEIFNQIDGRIVSDTIWDIDWDVCFPNMPLTTSSGKRFNVMGIAMPKKDGKVSAFVYLAMEPKTDLSNVDSIFTAGALGTVFLVWVDGRVKDKGFEKQMIPLFRYFAKKFSDEYDLVPGFAMFLSDEQLEYGK